MDMKRLVIGTIVGGVTLHAVGYLIFDVAIADYYIANRATPSAFRDVPMQWALALGNLALGTLITLGVLTRGSAPTLAGGFVVGAVIGFLAWFHVDFVIYSYTNLWNFPIPIVDPLLEIIHAGVTGAVIAAVLARVPAGATVRTAS